MRSVKIALTFVLLICFANVKAQTKKQPRPVLTTLVSQYKDSVKLNAEEAERVIAQPLRVIDDKKTVYTIASYQFLYRRNVVTEDEQTGKITPTTSIASQGINKQNPILEVKAHANCVSYL